jgi:hypothetical protein
MTESENRSSSGSLARRERWVWWLAGVLFLLALVLYTAVDRDELYAANIEWWGAVLRQLLGR